MQVHNASKNRNAASEIIFLHFLAIRDGFILGRTQFCSLCSASVYKSNSLFSYWTSWSLTQRQDKPICYFLSGGLFFQKLSFRYCKFYVPGLVLKSRAYIRILILWKNCSVGTFYFYICPQMQAPPLKSIRF